MIAPMNVKSPEKISVEIRAHCFNLKSPMAELIPHAARTRNRIMLKAMPILAIASFCGSPCMLLFSAKIRAANTIPENTKAARRRPCAILDNGMLAG